MGCYCRRPGKEKDQAQPSRDKSDRRHTHELALHAEVHAHPSPMDGGYPSGAAPPQMMGYYQGVPGYGMRPPLPNPPPSPGRAAAGVSIWAGDLDSYMDENFLRSAVAACGWAADITRIKVVRDRYSGMHSGYGFLDAASPEAAARVLANGSGMPIPGTNRCWRLNMGRSAAQSHASSGPAAGAETNVYVGDLEPAVTDFQLMSAFRPRYASVRHAKVVCNEYGQSRGFGFVRFADPHEAERAVTEMQAFEFNGKPIRLSPATGRSRGGAPGGGAGAGAGPVGPGGPGTRALLSCPPGAPGGPAGYGAYNPLGAHHGAHHGAHGHLHHHPHHHHHHHGGMSDHGGPSTNKRPRQLMSPDDPNNTSLFIGGTAAHVTEELLWREFSLFGELEAVRVPVNKTGFAFVRFKTRECAERAKDDLSGTHFISLNPHKPVRLEWASEQLAVTKPPPVSINSMPVIPHGAGDSSAVAGGSQRYDPQFAAQYSAAAAGLPVNNSNTTASGPYGFAAVAVTAAGQSGQTNAPPPVTTLGGAPAPPSGLSAVVAPPVTNGVGAVSTLSGSEVTTGKETLSSEGAPSSSVPPTSVPPTGTAGAPSSSVTVGSVGETEPPSKRAAVGRSEYAAGGTETVDGKPGSEDAKNTSGEGVIRVDRVDQSMQFSWLNGAAQPSPSRET